MTEILSTLAALCCDTVILLNVILFGNLDCGNLNIFKMLNPELIFLRLYSLQILVKMVKVEKRYTLITSTSNNIYISITNAT